MSIFSGENGALLVEALKLAFERFSDDGEWEAFRSACSKLTLDNIKFIENVLNDDVKKEDIEFHLLDNCQKCRIANAVFILETELEKTKNSSLICLCISLVSDEKVVTFLDKTYFGNWEWSLFKNKILEGEDLSRLWEICHHKYPHAYGTPVRDIAKHKNCPPELLQTLYQFDKEEPLRRAIALHKNTTDSVSNLFVTSKRKRERMTIAESKYLGKEQLEILRSDSDKDVRHIANKHYYKRFK